MIRISTINCDEAVLDRLMESRPDMFRPIATVDYRDGKAILDGGKGRDRELVINTLAAMMKNRHAHREGARVEPVQSSTAADAATEKQISYLRALIRRDPGEASNFGLTVENAAALTKSQASKMIDMLR